VAQALKGLLGRTNWAAPPVWFAPVCDRLDQAQAILDALPPGSVVAISGPVVAQACLGRDVVKLFDVGHAYEGAANAGHAADLVAADLMQAMSLAGASSGLLVTMPVRQAMWGGQMDGALRALEGARQDGIVRHLGLRIAGPWGLVEPAWRSHDAFEFVVCPATLAEQASGLASERRVGLVSAGASPFGQATLVEVQTRDDLATHLASVTHGT